MLMGVGLPPAFLAGEEVELFSEALGAAPIFLRELASEGVAGVELRAVHYGTEPDLAVKALRAVYEAGLRATVHGDLPPEDCPELSPALRALGGEARRRRREIVVTVHCRQSHEDGAETLAARTVDAVGRLLDQIRDEDLPLRIALELNRAKAVNDPSTTYAELLDMHAAIGDSRLGFCWDLAHAYVNTRRGLLTMTPPEAFVRHTINVHLSAVGPTGTTHWPLTAGELPLEGCLQALAGGGYGGVLNLELEVKRFADSVDISAAFCGSVRHLRGAIKAIVKDAGDG